MNYFAILLLAFALSCSRGLQNINEAMRTTDQHVDFVDQMDKSPLVTNIKNTIERLKHRNRPLHFGRYKVEPDLYSIELAKFAEYIEQNPELPNYKEYINKHFDILEIHGSDRGWGEVMFTGYYTPVLKASKRKTKEFSYPLYKSPEDLIAVDLRSYRKTFDGMTFKSNRRDLTRMRGRLADNKVVPYYAREDIDFENKLSGQKLEIAYVDPLDGYFMHIQGSGKLLFKNKKELYIGYADQNGHPFYPIGKELIHKIPVEEMSMDKIKDYLRSAPAEEARAIISKDPSYVFFKTLTTRPMATLGSEAIGQRTIATDGRYFSKGTLAYIEFGPETKAPPRFVIDADTGGAIRGGGRVDVYMGEGQEAADQASGFREFGRLYFMIPKSAIKI